MRPEGIVLFPTDYCHHPCLPKSVADVFERILVLKKEHGMTVIIVEQKVRQVAEICDKMIALKMGKIFQEGTPASLMQEGKLRQAFLW